MHKLFVIAHLPIVGDVVPYRGFVAAHYLDIFICIDISICSTERMLIGE